MKRFESTDAVLLALLLGIWVVAFGLHVRQVVRGRLAWVGVFVSATSDGARYPVVRAFWPGLGAERSGLQPGDRLRRVGDMELAGVGPVGFVARAEHAAGPDLTVPVAYERAGSAGTATLQLTRAMYPWRILPLTVALAVTGALVLVRAPTRRIGRGFFLAAIAFACQWTFFPGGPPAQTYAWAAVFLAASAVTFPLWLRALLVFPAEIAPHDDRLPWWPWVFVVLGPVAASWVFGTPLPPPRGQQAASALNVVFIATVLIVITRNYRRAGPVGRRQMKWVLYGLYLGLVPVVGADVVTAVVPTLWWLHDLAAIAEIAIPLSILVAIVRFNTFDIDRLIAATAAYSILSVIVIAGLLTVVPAAAGAMSAAMNLDPWAAQLGLGGLLAGCIVPAQRYLHPRIDRLFFAERYALREGVDALLAEVALCDSREAVLGRASARLHDMLRLRTFAAYARAGDRFMALEHAGDTPPPVLGADSPMVAAIAGQRAPLDLQGWRGTRSETHLGPGVREQLAAFGASVVLPVHRGDALSAFIALGEKRSGDVYTTTDIALLGAVASQLSSELLRLDLGRYAPRAVVDEILRDPALLEPRQREVTILFSDIRGSTAIAERLDPADLRGLQDEYFRAMAEVIARHEGLLVKTIGDAVMALWNAPIAAEDHPARACRAAVEMLRTLARLNDGWRERAWPEIAIRVGIHSGPADVGSFGTSARVEYDARGDAVNLASRLEGLGKVYGARAVVSEATRRALDDDFLCRPLDRVRVVGKTQPVGVYELLGRRADDPDGVLGRLADLFASALAAYRAQSWDEAIGRFERLGTEYPDDDPTRAYVERCRALRVDPPGEGWDGVYEARTK